MTTITPQRLSSLFRPRSVALVGRLRTAGVGAADGACRLVHDEQELEALTIIDVAHEGGTMTS